MDLKKFNQPFNHIGSKDIGVLLIHGFTSTTSGMIFLAQQFSEADFHVELPSLPGHGTTWQDLNKTIYKDWIEELQKSLQILKSRTSNIYVCGLSLGGALALRMAQLNSEISGIILINNACKFTHPKFWFVPIIRFIISSTPAIASDIKNPEEKEIAYDRTPTNGVYQMLRLLKIIRKKLPQTKQPVLIFKSKEDHVIPRVSALYTLKKISSSQKELIWLENSYHVATMDFDKELIAEKSIEFILQPK